MTEQPSAELAALIAADADAPVAPVDEVTQSTLDALVSEMLDLKHQTEELDALLKETRAKFDEIRKRRLPDLMQSLGLVRPDGKGGFTHSSGAKIHLRLDVYAHFKKEYEEDVFTWLRENGHGGLIKETINANTLKAWVKEQVQDGNPLPPQITVSPETVAVLTAPKGGDGEA